ncbi:Rne/Rng family ribonuclease [Paenibacillus sp. N1-5-1-14]|uniref:Rne/Rng family ribonuclease n=1 Tax=Paenibacillus radicibacter TaxID=2972488 RepID=UPI00215932DA|nr:Rne/Rng family ribonuclease [Paenibacillus radicibacter]MCR8644137.1 Rne/Rng family ribonuclease [Paenibacillus radicibacter]
MRQVIVHCKPELTQAVVIEDGKLVEYDVQHLLDKQRAGSIYLGCVVNVLPGMQAAFVDIGLEKNAFLYIDDLLPVHLEKQPQQKPPIADLITVGQELMVQVVKDPEGTKGARITTHFSIPGRWIVYMPHADYVAASRKIESDAEKTRLKMLMESLKCNEEGIIVRTVASGQSEDAIQRDLVELRELWKSVVKKSRISRAPAQLYQDLDLLPKLARDVINEDVSEVWIDRKDMCEEMQRLIERQLSHTVASTMPSIQLYKEPLMIFDKFGVTDELSRAFRRKVWLPSGGYLVIDPTEALTVIDVNTGKFVGSMNLEETVFQTNLEAASEIARLLRLRNIRGMIVIDFIDMVQEANRAKILETLVQATSKDRSKTIVIGWTKLGLLEMTRKRK